MLVNETFFINSCDDEELDIKRTSKLEYRLSFDDEKEIKALVFITLGTGSNTNISFIDFDREYLAKNFPVAVVSVFYHCFCVRPNPTEERYSAKVNYENQDVINIFKTFKDFHFNPANSNPYEINRHLIDFNAYLSKLKQKSIMDKEARAVVSAIFYPPNDEYQNYGIMSAIDHINALKDLCKRYPKFKTLPKLWGGGSYGGYLALFIAKIAPWYVDAALDNSGSALPVLDYIIGRDLNKPEAHIKQWDNLWFNMFVKTKWNAKDENSPYFFSKEHYKIRSLLVSTHLELQAKKNEEQILISYHSKHDEFGTAKDKEILFNAYKELGLDATLHLIKDEKEIDKRYIKNLKHSLGMSDRALFRKELPPLLERFEGKKFRLKKDSISYICGNLTYTFKDKGDKFKLDFTEV